MSLGHICSDSLHGGYCECFYKQSEVNILPLWEDTTGDRHELELISTRYIQNCINYLYRQSRFYQWCELTVNEWLIIFNKELNRRAVN